MDAAGDLSRLRDIVEPAAVPGWPPAPGVWAILGIAALWILAGFLLAYLRRRRNAYRRAALSELGDIRRRLGSDDTRGTALQEVPVLLKRVALVAFPRESVASLSGDAWLAFLRRAAGGTFDEDAGQWLARLAYAPGRAVDEISPAEIEGLMRTVERWIRRHEQASSAPRHTHLSSPVKGEEPNDAHVRT